MRFKGTQGRRLQRFLALLAAIVLLVGLVPPADAADVLAGADVSKLEPALVSQLRAGRARDRYPVIVQRQRAKDRSERRARELEIENEIKGDGGRVVHRLGIIDGHALVLPARAIVRLSKNAQVKAISADHPVRLTQLPPAALLSTWIQDANVPATQTTYGVTGAGVSVAVLDSGVLASPDLSNVVMGVDVVYNTTTLGDLGGHGSHVAGIIAGNGAQSNGAYKGVAPGARIVSVKVTTDDGHASYSNIIKGLMWVIANKATYNIRVVNMSLGATATAGFVDDPMDAAVEVAWFRGITVVVSAGNTGPGASTINVPGNDPYVVTVGAIDDNLTGLVTADNLIPDWTSRGPTPFDNLPKPDLVASGRKVVSLRSLASFLDVLMPDRVEGNGKYFRLSGTSMSAPVVAGVAALVLQARPSLSNNQVKYILKQTARPMAGGVNTVGAGAVNAQAAVAMALQGVPNGKANVGQVPNRKTATAVWNVLKKMSPVWRNTGWYGGRYWVDGSWDQSGFRNNGIWNDGGWDQQAWNNFNWEDGGWDDGGWDDGGWDLTAWADGGWDSGDWDSGDWSFQPID